jgi:hypothetical protein
MGAAERPAAVAAATDGWAAARIMGMRTAVGTREVLRRRRASEKASQQIVMRHANVLVTGGDMVWLSTL